LQQLGNSTEANLKEAAANTGSKIKETGAVLNNAQAKAGMPADSLIDKIGRSFREKSGSVGSDGAPSTIFKGKQKASVPFQQKQPAVQKTKPAAAEPKFTVGVGPPKTQPAAPAQPNSTQAKAEAKAAQLAKAGGGAPVDSLILAQHKTASSVAQPNSTQAKAGGAGAAGGAGGATDSLVDKIGAKFRGSGGSVGANGAPSTGLLGSRPTPAPPASAFPKDRKASQEVTGVHEVRRTANMHEVSSGVARIVDKPYTSAVEASKKVNSAGRSLNDIVDRVTDQPMDGSRR